MAQTTSTWTQFSWRWRVRTGRLQRKAREMGTPLVGANKDASAAESTFLVGGWSFSRDQRLVQDPPATPGGSLTAPHTVAMEEVDRNSPSLRRSPSHRPSACSAGTTLKRTDLSKRPLMASRFCSAVGSEEPRHGCQCPASKPRHDRSDVLGRASWSRLSTRPTPMSWTTCPASLMTWAPESRQLHGSISGALIVEASLLSKAQAAPRSCRRSPEST